MEMPQNGEVKEEKVNGEIKKEVKKFKELTEYVDENKLAEECKLKDKKIVELQQNEVELECLRIEKRRLENELNGLLSAKRQSEQKYNDIQCQLNMEKSMCQAFKKELELREDDMVRREQFIEENHILQLVCKFQNFK